MGNAHAQLVVVGQRQRGCVFEAADNVNVMAIDPEVSLVVAFDANAIIDVLEDAGGAPDGVAMVAVAGNDAELELLQVLVAVDASYKAAAVDLSRHVGIEFVAQKLK